jgi:hypothetical protein
MAKGTDPKKRAERDYHEVFQAVRSILLKTWDPLGVKDHAPGGYDAYAAQVVFLAKTGASVADIGGHLAHLETSQMGLSGKAAERGLRCKKSGEAVVRYFKKRGSGV